MNNSLKASSCSSPSRAACNSGRGRSVGRRRRSSTQWRPPPDSDSTSAQATWRASRSPTTAPNTCRSTDGRTLDDQFTADDRHTADAAEVRARRSQRRRFRRPDPSRHAGPRRRGGWMGRLLPVGSRDPPATVAADGRPVGHPRSRRRGDRADHHRPDGHAVGSATRVGGGPTIRDARSPRRRAPPTRRGPGRSRRRVHAFRRGRRPQASGTDPRRIPRRVAVALVGRRGVVSRPARGDRRRRVPPHARQRQHPDLDRRRLAGWCTVPPGRPLRRRVAGRQGGRLPHGRRVHRVRFNGPKSSRQRRTVRRLLHRSQPGRWRRCDLRPADPPNPTPKNLASVALSATFR